MNLDKNPRTEKSVLARENEMVEPSFESTGIEQEKALTVLNQLNQIDNLTNSHLLVICETSPQREIIQAFQDFEEKFGLDCSSIIKRIEHHNQYITNEVFYFKYNSKLSFLQKFRSKKEDVLKLEDFYNTFDKTHTYFWTITKKTLTLNKIAFKQSVKRTKIEFEEINNFENNLRQLLWRLEEYGYHITKYILVPEIKDSNGLYNYHFHMLLESYPDISKIRTNKNPLYRELVFKQNKNRDLDSGWINNPILSEIWKDITKDGSYRIKPERIRKDKGVFHYCLSYMNKGIKYSSPQSVPYMYYALKSKKAYRTKGLKKMPRITFKTLTREQIPIIFNWLNISFINKEDIPIVKQEYILRTLKDDKIIEDKLIEEYFKEVKQTDKDNNERLSNFDKRLVKSKHVFTKKYNWEDVEKEFTQTEITKMLTEGTIYETSEGYQLL